MVLSVNPVKVHTAPDNPQEIATMDESKKQLLKDIFWEMNEISSSTNTKTETVITETGDGHGNIVETESTVTQAYLYSTVSHKTADEMAAQYGLRRNRKSIVQNCLPTKTIRCGRRCFMVYTFKVKQSYRLFGRYDCFS